MKVTIEFDTDNAAFDDGFHMEITRVMKSAKDVLSESCNNTNINRQLIDSNGNRIGYVTITQI